MHQFKIVAEPKVLLGESPIWDEREERFYWIDSTGGALFCAAPDGSSQRVWKFEEMVGSFALREAGGGIITTEKGINLIDLESGELELIGEPEPETEGRFNDGKVDREGRFLTGSMDYRLINPATNWLWDTAKSPCNLYRVDADHSITAIEGDLAVTNGPAFSPDGRTFYLSNSWANQIYAYDYGTDGELSERRVFASYREDKTATGAAEPDGSTVDEEGYLWSVAVYGGEIRRYAPDGSLDRRIKTPVIKPTSLIFGGSEMDVLYITSMANAPDLPWELPVDGPLAGAVFSLHGLGVRGIPETRFAG